MLVVSDVQTESPFFNSRLAENHFRRVFRVGTYSYNPRCHIELAYAMACLYRRRWLGPSSSLEDSKEGGDVISPRRI